MSLDFLKKDSADAYRQIEADLKHVDPTVNLGRFKAMTPKNLKVEMQKLADKRQTMIAESTYGAWLKSPAFAKMRLLQEALNHLYEYKAGKEEQEVLVPGFTYYRGVRQFGEEIVGKKCYYVEGHDPIWQPFRVDLVTEKAKQVLTAGDQNDFLHIYVELADGSPDALDSVSLEHVSESSEAAKAEINTYCDGRWGGPWPWEMPSPYKLRTIIEDNREMKKNAIAEMQAQFSLLLRRIDEDSMEKYEVMSDMQETADKIEKMIQELGKIMGEGLVTLKANAQVSLGPEAAEQVSNNLTEPLNGAVQALTDLLAQTKQTMQTLESGGMDGDMGGGMGAEMGAPGGAPELGGAPDAEMGAEMGIGGDEGDLATDLADVELGGGDDAERIKKEL